MTPGWALLPLLLVVLLEGCASVPARGSLTRGRGSGPWPAAAALVLEETGGAGGFPEPTVDSFQEVQQASGLEEAARHPVGAALSLEQARQLLSQLARAPVTQGSFAPRRVLYWLLGEVLAGGEGVESADLLYRKPTTRSQPSLDYQEQVTGRPAWWVYMIGKLEFDGFKASEFLEAKGPGYCAFFNADGSPKSWYVSSGKFNELMEQAKNQSRAARPLGIPVTWHVADAKVAEFLRKIFANNKWNNITVLYTQPMP